MVKLRLKRMGNKHNAFYRIVAANASAPRDGKFIEEIGNYNPHNKTMKLDLELKTKWLNFGAQPTKTVKRLIKKFESLKNKTKKDISKNEILVFEKSEKKKKSKKIDKNQESKV